MAHIIYGLCEPEKPSMKTVRYVGYTHRVPERRLYHHIRESMRRNTCHRHRWIRSLIRRDLKPVIIVIEEVTSVNWQDRERYWIAKLKKTNDLVNFTIGGEGLVGAPKSLRRRIAKKLRGRIGAMKGRHWSHPMSEETKLKIGEAVKNSKRYKKGMKHRRPPVFTEEGRKRLASNKGKTFSEDHRRKIGEASRRNETWRTMLGTRWINRGGKNRKLRPNQPLPEGWEYGRAMNKDSSTGKFLKSSL